MERPAEASRRVAAFGHQLVEVHVWLRDELAGLRANVDSYLHGRGERPRQLRAHCLTFCAALRRHHTGEDAGAFPVLAERFPELQPALEELGRDHRVVDGILRKVEALLARLGAQPVPVQAQRAVLAELDGLAALLESHFGYEEKRLVSALNTLTAPAWEASSPEFLWTSGPGDA